MSKTTKTNHYDGNGNKTEVSRTEYSDGSSKTVVRENPDPVFKGGVSSITKTDSSGNSKTKNY